MLGDGLIDLTKDRTLLRTLYAPPAGDFSIVDVPKLPFAVLEGDGPPVQAAIEPAVKALFTAIYPIRREARQRAGKSFVEAPLEILYWAQDMRDLAAGNREAWKWRVQITLPIWADADHLARSVSDMQAELQGAGPIRYDVTAEGRCVQTLHVGPPAGIPETLARLYDDFLPRMGLEPEGRYHEIYLDDWSRVASDRCKIILRQPLRSAQ